MLRGFRRTLLRPDGGDGGGDATTPPADAGTTETPAAPPAETGDSGSNDDGNDDADADEPDTEDKSADDVDAIRRALRKANTEAKNHRLAAKEATDRATKAEQERDDALGRAEKAEMDVLRMTAARAAGLPDDLATRLVGDSSEELKADAARLAGLIAPAGTTNPLHAGTGTTGDDAGDLSPRDRLNRGFAASTKT